MRTKGRLSVQDIARVAFAGLTMLGAAFLPVGAAAQPHVYRWVDPRGVVHYGQSLDGMPAWAQAIGNALPLTHFVRATRGVLVRGAGAALVTSEMRPVALFTLVATAAALLAYRRRLD